MDTINLQNYVRAKCPIIVEINSSSDNDHDITTDDGEIYNLSTDEIEKLYDIRLYDVCNLELDTYTAYEAFCELNDYEPLFIDGEGNPIENDLWGFTPEDGHPHAEEYETFVETETSFYRDGIYQCNIEILDELIGKPLYGKTRGLYIDTRQKPFILVDDIPEGANEDDFISMDLYLHERNTESWAGTVEAAVKVGKGEYYVVTTKYKTDTEYPLSLWHISGDEADLIGNKAYIKNAPTSIVYGRGTATDMEDAISQMLGEMDEYFY